ncbi:MAG TPA: fumarylacetoacetate hydrolase family protein [Xanthobacteraceae bacterium]|nr:fumarylacetoacetate hydrolase family protein [Xanthobacteraceae bacterium]
MVAAFNPEAVARHIDAAHARRDVYANLPPDLAPTTVADAYAAQQALARRLAPRLGGIAGLKIATTTRVMQELMGIDHPCGGVIFGANVHSSPAQIPLASHVHLMIECELAVRLRSPLPHGPTPYTAETVRPAVSALMPAFELIDDRHADYKSANALSLIADNCWNAGVVLGAETALEPTLPLSRIAGTVEINGQPGGAGTTDDPLGALAWLANLAAGLGQPLEPGMVVITGSVVPTLPIGPTDEFVFRLEGLGTVQLRAL